MSKFNPRVPKYPWREFLTAAETEALAECNGLIESRKVDLANARRLKASVIATATARAKAHAGREGR